MHPGWFQFLTDRHGSVPNTCSTVNHAMANADEPHITSTLTEKSGEMVYGAGVAKVSTVWPILFAGSSAVCKFDARRLGIQNRDCFGHKLPDFAEVRR